MLETEKRISRYLVFSLAIPLELLVTRRKVLNLWKPSFNYGTVLLKEFSILTDKQLFPM